MTLAYHVWNKSVYQHSAYSDSKTPIVSFSFWAIAAHIDVGLLKVPPDPSNSGDEGQGEDPPLTTPDAAKHLHGETLMIPRTGFARMFCPVAQATVCDTPEEDAERAKV